jgi:hypothetical protein
LSEPARRWSFFYQRENLGTATDSQKLSDMEDVNGDEIDPGGVTVLVDCERQDDWSRSNGYREGTLEAYKGTSQVRRWREKATASRLGRNT